MKYLIVAADDFGYSPGVCEGIIKAHTDGIVTSASVLVDSVAADKAKELVNYLNLSVGLHINIWDRNLGGGPDEWKMDKVQKIQTIQEMFDRQLAKFKEITGHDPDHIDGHFHIQLHPFVRPIIESYSKKHNIPIRAIDSNFIDSFFARNENNEPDATRITVDSLIKILSGLGSGINEILTHAGNVDPQIIKISRYSVERGKELETLTDPRVRKFIENNDIKLINWREIKEL